MPMSECLLEQAGWPVLSDDPDVVTEADVVGGEDGQDLMRAQCGNCGFEDYTFEMYFYDWNQDYLCATCHFENEAHCDSQDAAARGW